MRKLDAYRVHLLQTMFNSLATNMVWTAMIIFRITVLGLNPLQLVLVGTTMETTVFLFEIPTGIVADLVSRRLSVIIGYVVIGVAYVFEGLLQRFEATMVAQVIWGVGFTFTSGAYDAWLVDEIGQERAGQAFMRGSQVFRVAGLAGMGLSVWLGSFDLRVPIILGGLLTILTGLFLAFAMPEKGFKPTAAQDRNTFQRMADTFREGVKVIRRRPTLLNILAISIFIGLYSEGWDRLWQKHMLDTFHLETQVAVTPITFFAILSVAMMGLSVVGTEIVRHRVDTNNPRLLTRTLFWFITLMVISIVVYGIAPLFSIALVTFFVFSLSRDLIGPLFSTWSNQHIDSQVRATVLSMQSQTDAIGQIVGGPPIGAVGQLSLQAAFVVSGVILSPAAFLLRRVYRREAAETEPVGGLVEAR